MTAAFVSGTFDVCTVGHLDLIRSALKLADTVFVGVATNQSKQCLISLQDRTRLLIESIHDVFCALDANRVKVVSIDAQSITVREAKKLGAAFVVRGIRSYADYEYERELAVLNESLEPEISTVVVFSDPAHSHIRSSTVKALLALPDWDRDVVKKMVPPVVLQHLDGLRASNSPL